MPLVSRPYLDVPKSCRRRSMPRSHDLLRLSLAAVRRSPQHPLVSRADRVHRIPKLCREPGIRWILQHASALAVLDPPSHFAAEPEVVTLIVNGPRFVGLHVDAIVGRRDELLAPQRLLPRQNADIGHADDRQPVPAFRAQSSAGAIRADGMRRLARTQ